MSIDAAVYRHFDAATALRRYQHDLAAGTVESSALRRKAEVIDFEGREGVARIDGVAVGGDGTSRHGCAREQAEQCGRTASCELQCVCWVRLTSLARDGEPEADLHFVGNH
jgi:hypothetical protein